MLEALTQAAGWLLASRAQLRLLDGGPAGSPECEIRPVRRAGQCPEIEVELAKLIDSGAIFKAAGSVNGAQALSARLELAYFKSGR